MKRPVSISIFGWIIIILAVISTAYYLAFLVSGQDLLHMQSRVPAIFHTIGYRISFLGVSIVNIIAGLFILQGRNWARWLYIILYIVQFVINFVIMLRFTQMLETKTSLFFQVIPSLLLFIIILVILFRPGVRPFFIHKKK